MAGGTTRGPLAHTLASLFIPFALAGGRGSLIEAGRERARNVIANVAGL